MFTQTSEYALRAVAWLAGHAGAVYTTGEIAEGTQVPTSYLSKVLQSLGRAGLLDSQRGLGGGFTLTKNADEITVLDVLNATDTPLKRIDCCPLKIDSHIHLCGLHRRIDHAIGLLIDYFDGTTIADVLVEEGKIKPLCEMSKSQQVRIATNNKNKSN